MWYPVTYSDEVIERVAAAADEVRQIRVDASELARQVEETDRSGDNQAP